eukprot:CAMPEP_0185730666 /NCGR_PEP_ID=MMETSP1171-20130828/10654_1 /TAXON_ID=374046 /ORGANISM="Helicotheca tamensis, Strain CCMP826" /LENGTH=207 /DNA_ID=CAMNT_0028399769 /DNA_START=112 /DNA_END=732 /DNA_ORIENTATION=-
MRAQLQSSTSHLFTLFLILLSLSKSYSFSCNTPPKAATRIYRKSFLHPSISSSLFLSLSSSPEEESLEGAEGDDEIQYESVVKINDGGSDLTDRFKYKVNALMGAYDPKPGTSDDEYGSGNILNAMLNFPTTYTFTVVGKTGNDDVLKENYVDMVKKVILDSAGGNDSMECRVTPRGSKFTRVSIAVTVESSAMINGIYDGLEEIEE